MPITTITGVILCGGRATRMQGRDKGLVELAGRPLAAYLMESLTLQVGPVLINANRNLERYAALGCPVIRDDIPGHAGPLAGMAAGMRAAQTPYLLTVPCDSPLPSPQLAARLHTALTTAGTQAAMARDESRMQPLFALIACSLEDTLREAVRAGERRPEHWLRAQGAVEVDFSDCAQMFLNLNDPAELLRMETHMAAGADPAHRVVS